MRRDVQVSSTRSLGACFGRRNRRGHSCTPCARVTTAIPLVILPLTGATLESDPPVWHLLVAEYLVSNGGR